jgi:hypothetical protein
MSDDDRRTPEPEEDRATLVRDAEGGARLVPDGNIVEGEIDSEAPGAPEPIP